MKKKSNGLRTIREADLKGKRVLLRADFNVPLDRQGRIADDFRISQEAPTINYILSKCPKQLIIMSHLGRPDGHIVPDLRLDAVAARLGELIKMPVRKLDDCIADMPSDCIVLLENLRFHSEEEANDGAFAQKLASYADIYVNDAMATSHRAHASTVGVTKFLPSYAGLLLEQEVNELGKLLTPSRPFVAIIGGAKISEKIGVIKTFMQKADCILIGGALANTFLKASGMDIADSRYEPEHIGFAESLLKANTDVKIGKLNCRRIMLPVDLAAGRPGDSTVKIVSALAGSSVPIGLSALDIGPETIALYSNILKNAKTIVWSGPMGMFEQEEFSPGTLGICRAVATSKARKIVGGGDTNDAIKKSGLWDRMGFVSTAGSAMLEFIEKGELPAISVLRKG